MQLGRIDSVARLGAALELFEHVYPGAMGRTGRDRGYYEAQLGRPDSVLLALEGTAGMEAVLLSGPADRHRLYFDIAVASPGDASSSRAALGRYGIDTAADQGWSAMSTSASMAEALEWEEAGFTPTLLVQLRGEDRFERRDKLVDTFGQRRALAVRDFGGGEVAQVLWRIDRVDPDADGELWLPGWRQYTTWLMYHWTSETRTRYVVGFHPRYRRVAIRECREIDPELAVTTRLDENATELTAGRPGHDLAQTFTSAPPVFARHALAVDTEVLLEGASQDIAAITSAVLDLPFDRGRSVAVECRKGKEKISGTHDAAAYTTRDVEIAVGTALGEAGTAIDLEVPNTVVVIYLEGTRALIGVAPAWTDPAHRAAPTTVSRAEHKLAEALAAFGLHPEGGWHALDLGAAPGGWSLHLAERGVRVTALDPARLAPQVAAHPLVDHLACRSEDVRLPNATFDLIVNDMVLDPEESAAAMLAVADSLKPDRLAVMTIKLPYRNPYPSLARARNVLSPTWQIVALRHLPHNRQEVTALLRKPLETPVA